MLEACSDIYFDNVLHNTKSEGFPRDIKEVCFTGGFTLSNKNKACLMPTVHTVLNKCITFEIDRNRKFIISDVFLWF